MLKGGLSRNSDVENEVKQEVEQWPQSDVLQIINQTYLKTELEYVPCTSGCIKISVGDRTTLFE